MENFTKKNNTDLEEKDFREYLEKEEKEFLINARDEILDGYKKDRDVNLERFALSESYRFEKNFRGEQSYKHRPWLLWKQNTFLKTISNSLTALERLKEKNFSKNQAITMLSNKPIKEWPEIVKEKLFLQRIEKKGLI